MSDASFLSSSYFNDIFFLHSTYTDQSVNEKDSDDLVGLLPEVFTSRLQIVH